MRNPPSLFFTVFFLVYGGMHVYAFIKARSALSFGRYAGLALFACMLVMLLIPTLVRFAERNGHETSARILAFTGYSWMGFIFLFVSAALVIDLYRGALFAAIKIFSSDLSGAMPSPGAAFFLPLAVAFICTSYGYFEANNIRTERLIIKTPKISKEVSRLVIAQISDVHLGLIVREERLKKILDAVRRENPDILVATGDLIDGQLDHLNGLSNLFLEIKPRLGRYAITGNHEFYAGIQQGLEFIQKAGFRVLRDEAVSVGGVLSIAGVDDQAVKGFGPPRRVSEQEILSGLPHDRFTLFLKHRPIIDKQSIGLFDLQLSGHTHKGQIFPFSLLTRNRFPNHAGAYPIGGNALLYVNRGSGTWGPPIRFLSPPEVTVIELVHSDTAQ